MQFEALCPFVRYAAKTTYLPNRFLVKARDCRLFYVLGGSGKFITPENSYPQSCAVSGRTRLSSRFRKRVAFLHAQFRLQHALHAL